MKDKTIIIILIAIIVILLASIGAMLLNQSDVKQPSKIKITSDEKQYEGGNLSVELSSLNNTPISKEIINITITDNNGKIVVDDILKTDEQGSAKLDLDLNNGNYTVNVTYGGNENHTGNTTTQKLSIYKEDTVTTQTQSEQYSSQSNYEDTRPAVDSSGITREEADKYGWTYTTKHGGHYIGSNDHWDEEAGVYHD